MKEQIPSQRLYVVNPSAISVVEATIDPQKSLIRQTVTFEKSSSFYIAFDNCNYSYADLFNEGTHTGSEIYQSARSLKGITTTNQERQYVHVFSNDIMSLDSFISLQKEAAPHQLEYRKIPRLYRFKQIPSKENYTLDELEQIYEALSHIKIPKEQKTKKYRIDKNQGKYQPIYGYFFTPAYTGVNKNINRQFTKKVKFSRE